MQGERAGPVADVAAIARDHRVARERLAPRELHAHADVSDWLCLGAAVGTRDPGDPDPEVGAEALDRAVGHRLGDLRRDRPVLVDQLRRHARAARPWPRSSRPPRRPRGSARRRAGRRSGPRAGPRCTTRPSAMRRPSSSSSATCWSIVEPSVLNDEAPVARGQARRPAPRARRRRHRPVANLDLELAPAQAGRDLERPTGRSRARSPAATWRSPTRECRTSAGSGWCRARPRPAPAGPPAWRSPPATSRAARAAGRAARSRSARPRPGRRARGPSRPGRSPPPRAGPSPACGWRPAAPRGRSASGARTRR